MNVDYHRQQHAEPTHEHRRSFTSPQSRWLWLRRVNWPLVLGVIWGLSILSALGLERWTGRSLTLCAFKLATGYPCPSCGSTRAGLRLLHADPIGAVVINPLMTMVMLAIVGMVTWRVLVAMRTRVGNDPGKAQARTLAHQSWLAGAPAVVVLLAFVAANWVYVIWRGN